MSPRQKLQLAFLCLARLADPLAATSLISYLLYQLRFLSPTASEGRIATQAAVILSSKTATKVLTGVFWGQFADDSSGGRKLVLLIAAYLTNIGLASVGYGFSTTFMTALSCQIVAGAMSSNIGLTRTIVADLYQERRARSRALRLLPAIGGLGMLFGPLIGGFLSVSSVDHSPAYPYAWPNLFVASVYGLAGLGVFFFVDETLEGHDPGRNVFRRLWLRFERLWKTNLHSYSTIQESEDVSLRELRSTSNGANESAIEHKAHIAFRDLWTRQLVCIMMAHFLIAGHTTAFTTLWAIFLSTPKASNQVPDGHEQQQPSLIAFTGGLGLSPASIGVLLSATAAVGVSIQLVVYPRLDDRVGTLRVWKNALWIFPGVYMLAPFPALVSGSDDSENGPSIKLWASIITVFLFFMAGRIFITPAMTILINDCVTVSSTRARINTAGTVIGNLSRSLCPVAAAMIYGWGLNVGNIGVGFWVLCVMAVGGIMASRRVGSLNAVANVAGTSIESEESSRPVQT